MKRLLLIFLLTTTAAGCQTDQVVIVKEKPVAVIPPDSFYKCPRIGKLPKPDTLTDGQVSDTLIDVVRKNKVCGASIDALKQFNEQAKASIEETPIE